MVLLPYDWSSFQHNENISTLLKLLPTYFSSLQLTGAFSYSLRDCHIAGALAQQSGALCYQSEAMSQLLGAFPNSREHCAISQMPCPNSQEQFLNSLEHCAISQEPCPNSQEPFPNSVEHCPISEQHLSHQSRALSNQPGTESTRLEHCPVSNQPGTESTSPELTTIAHCPPSREHCQTVLSPVYHFEFLSTIPESVHHCEARSTSL